MEKVRIVVANPDANQARDITEELEEAGFQPVKLLTDQVPSYLRPDYIARCYSDVDRILGEPTNPVVRETRLRVAPGWAVREYQDGLFDAYRVGGLAVSPGFDSFQGAVAWAKDPQ
jgi:hypothetical protein